jgi:hypothetical protein
LISPPKVIYAQLFYVKDTPHFFFNLFQNHPVGTNIVWKNIYLEFFKFYQPKATGGGFLLFEETLRRQSQSLV